MTGEPYQPAYAPLSAETERAMLKQLSYLASRDPARTAVSTIDTATCLSCGLRPRNPNLCEDCEARRQRLAAKHPDVPQLKAWSDPAPLPATEPPQQPTFDVAPRREEWLPYPEDRD